MLEELQKEVRLKAKKEEYETRQEVVKAERRLQEKKKHSSLVNEGGGNKDWTASYAKWNAWAEEEALKEEIEKQRKQAEVLRKRRDVAGCSHDHSAERALVEKPNQDKLRECHTFRKEGNAWFQEGQHFRAREKYRKVLVWLDYTFAENDNEQEEMDQIQLPALVNMAICSLKLRDYPEAIQNARLALQLDENNVKALYCKAKAHRSLDDFASAEKHIKRALQLDPANVQLRREYVMLQNKRRRYKADSARQARAMFNPVKTDDLLEARSEDVEEDLLTWSSDDGEEENGSETE